MYSFSASAEPELVVLKRVTTTNKIKNTACFYHIAVNNMTNTSDTQRDVPAQGVNVQFTVAGPGHDGSSLS